MSFFRLLILALATFMTLTSCESKYTESPSESVLVMPKADCGGDPCL